MLKKILKSLFRISVTVFSIVAFFYFFNYMNLIINENQLFQDNKRKYNENQSFIENYKYTTNKINNIYNQKYTKKLPKINKQEIKNIIENPLISKTYINPFAPNNIVNIYKKKLPTQVGFLRHLKFKVNSFFVDRSDKAYAERPFVPYLAKNNIDKDHNLIRIGQEDVSYIQNIMSIYNQPKEISSAIIVLHEIAHMHPFQKQLINQVWKLKREKQEVLLVSENMADIMAIYAAKIIYNLSDNEFLKLLDDYIMMRTIGSGKMIHLTSGSLFNFKQHYIYNKKLYKQIEIEDIYLIAYWISEFSLQYNYSIITEDNKNLDYETFGYFLNQRVLFHRKKSFEVVSKHINNYIENL